MPGERAVLCDLDGTLADTRAANCAAYALAFESEGLAFPETDYRAEFGLGFADMMAAIAPDVDAATAQRIAAEKARVYPDFFALVRPNLGLVALLGAMRADGRRIGLATTARRANVLALLKALNLADLFDVVVTAEDVSAGKPAPDAYLVAAERLGADPRDCIVFEDSEHGVRSAAAAGCAIVKVSM